jgi:hypothetical protein
MTTEIEHNFCGEFDVDAIPSSRKANTRSVSGITVSYAHSVRGTFGSTRREIVFPAGLAALTIYPFWNFIRATHGTLADAHETFNDSAFGFWRDAGRSATVMNIGLAVQSLVSILAHRRTIEASIEFWL